MQPGVVADPVAALGVLRQPLARRRVDQVLDGEHGLVDLCVRLHGVTAVDEDGGLVGQHDRSAGRAGEAGQPGQAFFAGGEIFVLLAVGARHDEAGEPAVLELRAQTCDAAGALVALARILEGLELRFEHGRHSSRLSLARNARAEAPMSSSRRVECAARAGNPAPCSAPARHWHARAGVPRARRAHCAPPACGSARRDG